MKRAAANSAAAYLAAVAFTFATRNSYDTDSPWETGLWGIPIYWAVAIALAVVNGLGGILYLWLAKGDDLEELVLTDLRNFKLPPSRRYETKNQMYLSNLVEDPDAACDNRIKAAMLSTQLSMIAKHAGFFGGIAWTVAADKAVLRYAQEAPELMQEPPERRR